MKFTEYMRWRDLDDSQMAAQIGCSASAVVKWRRGERVPRPQQIIRIREVTDGRVGPEDWFPSKEAAAQ
jgi:transcriptional regulator with XRE-family HTH domain